MWRNGSIACTVSRRISRGSLRWHMGLYNLSELKTVIISIPPVPHRSTPPHLIPYHQSAVPESRMTGLRPSLGELLALKMHTKSWPVLRKRCRNGTHDGDRIPIFHFELSVTASSWAMLRCQLIMLAEKYWLWFKREGTHYWTWRQLLISIYILLNTRISQTSL